MIKAILYPMLIFLVAVAAMLSGNAQAAKFDVPQGDERLPTIALIECLAEENSRSMGEYCYATYSCSPAWDGDRMRMPGTLWRGLPYHDSRRVTTADDDIAFGRSCVITVADDAKITWFTGYRPDGEEGEVVGIVKAAGATPALPHDNMLEQFIAHKRIGGQFRNGRVWYDETSSPRELKTLDDLLDYMCGLWQDSYCRSEHESNAFYLESIPATLQTGCYVEHEIAEMLGYSRNSSWMRNVVNAWDDKDWPHSCPDAED